MKRRAQAEGVHGEGLESRWRRPVELDQNASAGLLVQLKARSQAGMSCLRVVARGHRTEVLKSTSDAPGARALLGARGMRRLALLIGVFCGCANPSPSAPRVEFQHSRIDAVFRALASKDDRVYAVNNVGEVVIRENGAWGAPSGQLALSLDTVWVNSAQDVWVGGSDGRIHRGDGRTWARVLPRESGLSATDNVDVLFGVAESSGADVWALTPERDIVHVQRGGWSDAQPLPEAIFRAGWAASSSDVWVVGDQPGPGLKSLGAIVHWDGVKWVEQTCSGCRGVLNAVWGLNAQDVWAAGDTVAHFDGLSWSTTPLPLVATVTALWGDAHDDFWAAIDRKPGLLHWDGYAWNAVEATAFFGVEALTGDAKQVWFSSEHKLFSINR